MKDKFNTELEFWEALYNNIGCVYNDDKRLFFIEVWRFNMNNVMYLPCVIDNIQTKLIRK